MKNLRNKILICATVWSMLLVTAAKTNAQQSEDKRVEVGARFMPTFSSFNLQSSDGGTVNGQITFGYGFGAFVGYNFTEHVGLEADVIYNTLSQKSTQQTVINNVKLKYVNIPLLLSLNTSKWGPVNLNFSVGPQFGIKAGAEVQTSGGADNDPKPVVAIRKTDLAIAYGAGLDFGLNAERTVRIGIGYRGTFGLLDISDNNGSAVTDSYFILKTTHIKTYAPYAGISVLF